MELITMHTHSTFCGHARDTLSDMVQAASDAGIQAFAATEHYPLPERYDTFKTSAMPLSRLEEYKQAVMHERELHPEMDVLLGCELDWLGAHETRDLTHGALDDFDIVLGSVHFIDTWLINSSRFVDEWERRSVDAVWSEYIDLWCDAAQSDVRFDVMAHPDVVKKFGFFPSFDLHDAYKRMAEAARLGNRMIEVNTSGLRNPYSEFSPGPDLLKEFFQAGIPCTVGTDAHNKNVVAAGVREAYDYMREAGYSEVTVFTPGGGRRYLPL